MAASKRKQILANVLTTLQGITTGNGFNYTVGKVTRDVKSLSEISTFPHINIYAGKGDKSWNTNNEVTEKFQIGLNYVYKGQHKPGTDNDLSDIAENIAQDLDNAILADIHRGHADFVNMTRPVLVEPYVVWEPHNSVVVDYIFEVEYWYQAGNA